MGAAAVVAPAAGQTITNTARADWSEGGVAHSTVSNTVTIGRATNPLSLETYHPIPGASSSLPIRASICGNTPLVVFPGSADGGVGVASMQTSELRIGEVLVIRASAPLANRSPSAVDRLVTTITTPGGDRETLEIFETGPDTGVFTGAIRTRAIPPSPTPHDCQLSVSSGEKITVALEGSDGAAPLIATLVAVLADPFGFVFDSEDGSPVSGAEVTRVYADTGQAATVFAHDGFTPWPSTVISGEPIRDAAGNIYPMQPGECRFPLAPLGTYRLVITPPAPYTAPSARQAGQLAPLTRPGDGNFEISDASTENFHSRVASSGSRRHSGRSPNIAVTITKSASRARVQPGDAIIYTVTLRNPDPARAKRRVASMSSPGCGCAPIWFVSTARCLRPARYDRARRPAPGYRNRFDRGGAKVEVNYAMIVRLTRPPDRRLTAPWRAINWAAGRGRAAVRIERDMVALRITIVGGVTRCCDLLAKPVGILGVWVMLENGSFVITDQDGRDHLKAWCGKCMSSRLSVRPCWMPCRIDVVTFEPHGLAMRLPALATGQGGSSRSPILLFMCRVGIPAQPASVPATRQPCSRRAPDARFGGERDCFVPRGRWQ